MNHWQNGQAHLQLIESFHSMGEIPPEEQEWVRHFFKPQRAMAGEMLGNGTEGPSSQKFFFVVQGLIRLFYCSAGGRESVVSFVAENNFYFPPDPSWSESGSSTLQGEVLETSLLLWINRADFNQLYSRHPCWERIGRVLAETHFYLKGKREEQLLNKSGWERYLDFLRDYPHLKGRIPQYQVASFINLAPQSLCRLMKKNLFPPGRGRH